MSALAVGAVSDGTAVISLGTSGTLFGCSSRPVFDKEGIICAFCDATGKYLPLICTLNCTGKKLRKKADQMSLMRRSC